MLEGPKPYKWNEVECQSPCSLQQMQPCKPCSFLAAETQFMPCGGDQLSHALQTVFSAKFVPAKTRAQSIAELIY